MAASFDGSAKCTNLTADINKITDSPLVDAMLSICTGLVAVLNGDRRVVGLNHAFLSSLGLDDPEHALGLRLGEVLLCVHRDDDPGGCGCSDSCETCGAAMAIMASLDEGTCQENDCVVRVERDGQQLDLNFRVKATPVNVSGTRYLLMFLQDITLARRQAELARIFLHDVSNIVQAIDATCHLLPGESPVEQHQLTNRARNLSRRLAKEIEVQRLLLQHDEAAVAVTFERIDADRILVEVEDVFRNHPLSFGKHLVIDQAPLGWQVTSDRLLLLRVLINMVTNALEATDPGGTVRLWCETVGDGLRFCVHSERAIPANVAPRIFQRHFSTKVGSGRGLGTYAMKLLGEQYLGGAVDFRSTPQKGTTFFIQIPVLQRV